MKPPIDEPEWMLRKERGNQFLLRTMTILSLGLGRRVSRTLVYAIALYFLLASPAARKSSGRYLQMILGRQAGWSDLYRHFLYFASTIHDRVYLVNDRHENFQIRNFGAEHLHATNSNGCGVLLLGAHFGSFEVMRSVARVKPDLKVCMAMYPENAKRITKALAAINPNAVQDIVSLGKLDAILTLHGKLNSGYMVGILADRSVGQGDCLLRPFLGQLAPFPIGPFRLAAMLRKPVYFMSGQYQGGNRYDVHFELLTDFSDISQDRQVCATTILEKYVELLETNCRNAPLNWFNFFDFWKPQ